MKLRFAFLALSVVLASGCGKEPAAESPVVAPEATASAEPAAIPDAGDCASAPGHEFLPEGVCLTPSYRFRDERQYVDGQGRNRRRITFDFMGGDAQAVADVVTKQFEGAGYFIRPKMDSAAGSLQIPMTKKGLGTTYLSITILPSDPSAGSEAKGHFFIDFVR